MKSVWRLVLALATATSLATLPAYGIPQLATVAAGESTLSAWDLPITLTETGTGPVAVVLVSGGQASQACLDRAAEALSPRYRVIRLALDEAAIDYCGGTGATAMALSAALRERGIEASCVVGCASAATIFGGLAYNLPAIQGLVLFGSPETKAILPVEVGYIASNAGPTEIVTLVDGFLAPSLNEGRGKSHDLLPRKGNKPL